MKRKMILLGGMILSALIGWALGFLRLPYIEKNFSFVLGFFACLACVSLGLILVFVWNKNSLLIRLIGKDPATRGSENASRTYALIWILVAAFIVLGGLVSSYLIFRQNALFEMQTQTQNQKIIQLAELIESTRSSSQTILVNNILDRVHDELKNSPKRTLSDETIAKIAALSPSFQPHKYLEGDSLSEKKFSPERGQLLVALTMMHIDSNSLNDIMLKVPFSGADLRGANLKGAHLSTADLRGANLKDADLSGAHLKDADLTEAFLWGARLTHANLSGANLKRATLGWAEMNGADLDSAVLDGADATDVKLNNANLSGASLKWADLSGAVLHEANLVGADFIGASLSRANLSKANLEETNLSMANLDRANLSGAKLTKTAVNEDNWIEKINEWQVIGAKEIKDAYKVVVDTSVVSKLSLRKIAD